jgi:hypothetical protein
MQRQNKRRRISKIIEASQFSDKLAQQILKSCPKRHKSANLNGVFIRQRPVRKIELSNFSILKRFRILF